MALIGPRLEREMNERPLDPLALIVRVSGEMSAVENELVAVGVMVRRSLTLIKAFAVTATSSQVTVLADKPWVLSIELDEPMSALSS